MYIKEAHPEDGWQMKKNTSDGIIFNQPKTIGERTKIATSCTTKLSLTMPCVLDDMKNSTEAAYSSWPDRLYIVGADGKIAYKGGQGPRGFKVSEMKTELKKILAAAPVEEIADTQEPVDAEAAKEEPASDEKKEAKEDAVEKPVDQPEKPAGE